MTANQTPQLPLLPEPTLRRLPWYLAYVTTLRKDGVEFVSSTRIAREIHVDSSQIAKDLSFLDIKGKTRIGYEVAPLERKLREYLGFTRLHRAVMLGVGSLGSALINDSGLRKYGLEIVAGIDVDPAIVGQTINGIGIHAPEDLPGIVAATGASIGIVAVPVDAAGNTAREAVAAGIKALWNFTPRRLDVPEGVVVTNTSIYSHLAVMYNRLNHV